MMVTIYMDNVAHIMMGAWVMYANWGTQDIAALMYIVY